jgi:UDP-2,3-diacylglucosamine pyrophosphatase LpxH
MTKCYFVSDLHILANRSNVHLYQDQIVHSASHADQFVFGGDTFDFRWSQSSIYRAVQRADKWLFDVTSACPKCQFHLVLGNHDYHQAFIDRLLELEEHISNLTWHRFFVRLGSSIFLHGDVAGRNMDAQRLADSREKWLAGRQHGPLANLLYDMVVFTRIHKPMPHLVYSKRVVVRRILKYLENINQGPANGVKNVYFGHTHIRMANYHYRGLAFHNGGAGIKGVKFRIIEAKC